MHRWRPQPYRTHASVFTAIRELKCRPPCCDCVKEAESVPQAVSHWGSVTRGGSQLADPFTPLKRKFDS